MKIPQIPFISTLTKKEILIGFVGSFLLFGLGIVYAVFSPFKLAIKSVSECVFFSVMKFLHLRF